MQHEKPILSRPPLHLVPFDAAFVEKYFSWMSDKQLAADTDSEGITVEDIREVQKMYACSDKDVCFIIAFDPDGKVDPARLQDGSTKVSELADMIVGDVNLFTPKKGVFEINIMIAEKSMRKKGVASAAFKMAADYARSIGKELIIAKINSSNEASLKFFEKLGFERVKEIPAFQQVEMHLKL